jgi:hypothetical protein
MLTNHPKHQESANAKNEVDEELFQGVSDYFQRKGFEANIGSSRKLKVESYGCR